MASAVRAIRKKKENDRWAAALAATSPGNNIIAGAPGQAVDLTGDGNADIVIPATPSRPLPPPKRSKSKRDFDLNAELAKAHAEDSDGVCDPVSWLPYREHARVFYQHPLLQMLVAVVIIGNFFAIIIEKEIDPYPTEHQFYPAVWVTIDDFCNVVFIFELLLNLYGSFWKPFFASAWNYLDTVVVIVGVTSLLRIDLGSFQQIKILRAFRVLRLFKRVESLNKILVALLRSIPGVLNAFLVMVRSKAICRPLLPPATTILAQHAHAFSCFSLLTPCHPSLPTPPAPLSQLIFMMVFAIISVDFFRDFGFDGEYHTTQRYGLDDARWGQGAEIVTYNSEAPIFENTTRITAMTARGFHFGQEYFGTFSRSLYTLFQVLTGESWSEAVVRPLLFGYASNGLLVSTFFVLYILLTQARNATRVQPPLRKQRNPCALACIAHASPMHLPCIYVLIPSLTPCRPRHPSPSSHFRLSFRTSSSLCCSTSL